MLQDLTVSYKLIQVISNCLSQNFRHETMELGQQLFVKRVKQYVSVCSYNSLSLSIFGLFPLKKIYVHFHDYKHFVLVLGLKSIPLRSH